VLQGLARPVGMRPPWGVVKTLVLGTLSFGLLPLLAWVRSFRAFSIAEQQQFVHLAQWVRENSSHPLARPLENDSRQLFNRSGGWVAAFLAVGTAVWIGVLVHGLWAAPSDVLLAGTYRYHHPDYLNYRLPRGLTRQIFQVWCGGLSLAYFFFWVHVRWHAQDVARFVERFNEIAKAEGINGIRATPLGMPLRPVWLVGAALWYAAGVPWGVVAMLAGAAQRRYITTASRQTRADLAHRLRAMLMRRRPSAAGVPVPVYLRDRCVEAKCRAELPRGVNYCPRCGTRQKAQVHRVA
jgi:hypothetical protein